MLAIGVKAPAFRLPDQNGQLRTIDEFKGKNRIFQLLFFQIQKEK